MLSVSERLSWIGIIVVSGGVLAVAGSSQWLVVNSVRVGGRAAGFTLASHAPMSQEIQSRSTQIQAERIH